MSLRPIRRRTAVRLMSDNAALPDRPGKGGEDQAITARYRCQQGNRLSRQWNPVLLPGFHSLRRDGPQLRLEVHFIPCGASYLARARRRKDRKFGRARRNAFGLREFHHERRDLAPGQRGMILDWCDLVWIGEQVFQVPAPARRVIALPDPADCRPVEDALDPSAQARGSLCPPI